jgi:hypothetical protein
MAFRSKDPRRSLSAPVSWKLKKLSSSWNPGNVVKSIVKRFAFNWLERRGYDVNHRLEPWEQQSKARFWAHHEAARARYDTLEPQLKVELPAMLEYKYAKRPILGRVRVSDAVAELATVIDPLDPGLGCVSQLTHQLQLAEAIERDGLDETFVTCALVHDLGKLLLKFTDEDPIHVEAGGQKAPIAGTPGGGLASCTFRWDHGDFAYLRLRDYVPDGVAWLLRVHSIDLEACEPYFDARDRAYVEQFFKRFVPYDTRKDMFALPAKRFEDYRSLLDRTFPEPILI